MKAFIAFIFIAIACYSTYYVIINKDKFFSSDVRQLSRNGIDYIAPNELDNPGYVYAKKDDQKIWQLNFSDISVDRDISLESDVLDYAIRNMYFDSYLGQDVLLIRVGAGARARTYTLDINNGKVLDIDFVNPPLAQ